ncbi:MAG: zf-HC2 domain-containing protein [Thermomicrobiales bacterium]|nr:zf-HC2 domain-containing protein [Thermomicrobiales bacterium]
MTMPASDRHRNQSVNHLTDAQLNELVDRTLAEKDRVAAQEHLAGCEECNDRYLTLLATVDALQHAPSLMPRRSFQLTPEQAKRPEKRPSRFDRFANLLIPGIPAIKAATIAVALLLISVTAFDVLTDQSSVSDNGQVTTMQDDAQHPAQSESQIQAPEAAVERTNTAETGSTAREIPDGASAGEASDLDGTDTGLGESDIALGEVEERADEPILAESEDSAVDQDAPEAPVMPAQAMPAQEAPAMILEASPSPSATATSSSHRDGNAEPSPAPTATPTPSTGGRGVDVSVAGGRARIASPARLAHRFLGRSFSHE